MKFIKSLMVICLLAPVFSFASVQKDLQKCNAIYDGAVSSDSFKCFGDIIAMPLITSEERAAALVGIARNYEKLGDKELAPAQQKKYFQKEIFWSNRALEFNSKDAGAYYSLGSAYRNLGDNVKAREYYRRALEIDSSFKAAECAFGYIEHVGRLAVGWAPPGCVANLNFGCGSMGPTPVGKKCVSDKALAQKRARANEAAFVKSQIQTK